MDDVDVGEIAELIKMLTPNTEVVFVDHDQYIKEARQHPLIRKQIDLGIYDEDSFDKEFLSVAKSYPDDRRIEVDLDLLVEHMKGVDLAAAYGYVAVVALHEYHHLIHHTGPPVSEMEQMRREVECHEFLTSNHPELMKHAQNAEAQSTIIQRVYSRMAGLA